jgi:hypothetical protein
MFGFIALAGALSLDCQSHAATVTIGASKDASIFQSNPNNGSGAGNGLYSGTNSKLSPRRARDSFDIAGNVPAGAVIQDAKLTLTLGLVAGGGSGGGSGSPSIELHRVNADWGEAATQQSTPPTDSMGSQGAGVAAQTNDVTWNSRFHNSSPATPWATPGGDFATSASAATSVGTTTNVGYVWSSPTMAGDVQAWLNSPSTNFGWLLLNADETSANTFRAFYSRNVATASLRPQLEITYAVPEPAAAMLMGVACAALSARRRRRDR